MGLKGFRLWAMSQLDSNVQSPNTLHAMPHSLKKAPGYNHNH
jgi:hypothetical protein